MTLSSEDRHALRYPLLGLGLALMLAILTIGMMQQRETDAQQALRLQQVRLEQTIQRYQAAELEKQMIARYLPDYRQLVAQGFVGEERRWQWLSTLGDIQHRHRLFAIDYQMTAQQVYKPAFWQDQGVLTLYRSVMRLQMAMLHEGDLLTLLDTLSVDRAPFMLRECEITRLTPQPSVDMAPHFHTACEIDWLTLQAATADSGP